jgi:hypothetical protein
VVFDEASELIALKTMRDCMIDSAELAKEISKN